MMKTLALAVAAVAAFTSCAEKNECKFNEKEYAERKTAHIDEIVDLTEEQEKEIYTIFEAQGLEIKENMKNMKCGECKPEECKKAECDKATCDKAECKKAECDKANCDKAECKKAECDKVDCKKAECDKAECKKAECDKANCDKAECKKAECDKANCDKAECKKAECDKANCDKAECKKAECDKAGRHHHRHHHMVAPEKMKETFEKVNAVLTPEQQELLKAHHAGRRECAASMQACCPTPAAN